MLVGYTRGLQGSEEGDGRAGTDLATKLAAHCNLAPDFGGQLRLVSPFGLHF